MVSELVNETVKYAVNEAIAPLRNQIINLFLKTIFKVIISIVGLLGLKFSPTPILKIIFSAIFAYFAIQSIISFMDLMQLIFLSIR